MLTEPLSQQRIALEKFDAHFILTREPHFAFFMEQGTGKTWVALALAERLFGASKIDLLVILALNGVHRNWTEREVPQHLAAPHSCFTWRSGMLDTQLHTAAIQKWRMQNAGKTTAERKLLILAVNVESLQGGMTSPIARLLQSLMRDHSSMLVVDESDTIASPSAARTRTCHNLSKESPYRLILTGTPVEESPFDAFAQMKFLSKDYLGYKTFADFKAQFAEFKETRLRPIMTANGPVARSYPKLIRYRNLPELKALMAKHSYTVRKKDCLDLPPKVHQTRLVEMSPEQAALYHKVRKQLIIELQTGRMTVANSLVRLTRLAQITGGWYATDDDSTPFPIAAINTKISSLQAYIRDLPRDVKAIVFARFVHECVAITAALNAGLPSHYAVRYWGDIPDDERHSNVDAFQNEPPDHTRFFVATKAACRGLTLTAATQVIYYSSSYSARDRAQGEDRAHRIGQTESVTYTDLLCSHTIDEGTYDAVRGKRDLASLFATDDPAGLIRWLEEQ